jgi:hypothetical protein
MAASQKRTELVDKAFLQVLLERVQVVQPVD